MSRSEPGSLWRRLSEAGPLGERSLRDVETKVSLAALARGSCLGAPLDELRGASVLIALRDQLPAALALIELDGVARRMVLCPPDLADEHLPAVMATAEIDTIVGDRVAAIPGGRFVSCAREVRPAHRVHRASERTEWVLFTSGTAGVPKLVAHTFCTLTGAIRTAGSLGTGAVWSTFYDIRRYGGLQIFLRAMLGGGSLVLSSAAEPVGDFLVRAGASGVTHISGTPSHWRRALMSANSAKMAPRYLRLSGEIADQAVLDRLHQIYPRSDIAHAFASTEAGVAFDVDDGLAGFPQALIGKHGEVELRVINDSLRIKSNRNALRYLGEGAPTLLDEDGFVDTGDMVELRNGRYYFAGRRGGIINIGGLKVHPEEVEAAINRHPSVRMSLVTARRNPITGAIVVADVVVRARSATARRTDVLKHEILEMCRGSLARHKVPAAIRFVPALEVAASGKVVRHA
jgi:acyl-coenzyme A synthetase/AMP-(fatty) acid ligase